MCGCREIRSSWAFSNVTGGDISSIADGLDTFIGCKRLILQRVCNINMFCVMLAVLWKET